MGEKYIIRRKLGKRFESVKHESIDDLPPLSQAVLLHRLRCDPSDKQPSADEIWQAWQAQHGQEQAPGRRLVRRADAVLEERGYKHRLIWRAGKERNSRLKVYNLPTLRCPDADCASCAERDEGTGTGTLHEQPEPAVEGTALDPLESGTPIRNKTTTCTKTKPQDVKSAESAESVPAQATGTATQAPQPAEYPNAQLGQQLTEADRHASFLIAAALGVSTGLLGPGDDYALQWMRRASLRNLHKTPLMYARYQARMVLAAPEQLRELCDLAADNRGYVQDDDAGPLVKARDLASRYRLSSRELEDAERVAEWACEVAQDDLDYGEDLDWTARTALEAAWLQWHQPKEDNL